jgi:hypothetical protein
MGNRSVCIARLSDHQATLSGAFLVSEFRSENNQREIDWLAPHFASADGRIGLSFHSLPESAEFRIVIYTSPVASTLVLLPRGAFSRRIQELSGRFRPQRGKVQCLPTFC